MLVVGLALVGVSGYYGVLTFIAGETTRQAVDALDETIRDIRSAIFTLQSRPQAGPQGVRTRILAVIEEMTSSLGFAPSVRLDERLDTLVPAEIAGHMLAALREALSNAARHAGATSVTVTATAAPDLTLIVRDNGTGMTETARRSGLRNLADRAAQLGGSLQVQPAQGGGTQLEWQVPLADGGGRPS